MSKSLNSEIIYHRHSFVDQSIRLFEWNGGLYRGISGDRAPYFAKLFQTGIIETLSERGLLIESKLAKLSINEYELIVQHRVIPFISYPHEWCAAMLKQAALTLIDLALELAHHQLTLGDGHPWNLLIDPTTCHPVFVDLGSITTIQQSEWLAYDEFCRFCLYPLILMADGQTLIARLLMCEDQGVLKSELIRFIEGRVRSIVKSKQSLLYRSRSKLWKQMPNSWRESIKKALQGAGSFRSQTASNTTLLADMKQKAHLNFLENVKREIKAIALPEFQPDSSIDRPEAIDTRLHKILSELQPASVLNVGYRTGRYAQLAARLGSQVVAFDTDEACITQLYQTAQAQRLPILPLVMDFTKPTPARGLVDHWSIAATERFQCDVVLAIGVLHRLVLEKRMNFEQIVEGFALFSKHAVVVEFVFANDQEIVKHSRIERCPWYNKDDFIKVARKQFDDINVLPLASATRVLLICRK